MEQTESSKLIVPLWAGISYFYSDQAGRGVICREFVEEHFPKVARDCHLALELSLQPFEGALWVKLGVDHDRLCHVHRDGFTGYICHELVRILEGIGASTHVYVRVTNREEEE